MVTRLPGVLPSELTAVNPAVYPADYGSPVPFPQVKRYSRVPTDYREAHTVPAAPNDLLRSARDMQGLTQAQLAELANAEVERATGSPGSMDGEYVGRLERGVTRWPNKAYRAAFRVVLGATADADLGFFGLRGGPRTVVGDRSPLNSMGGRDDVERQTFLRVLAGSVAGLAFNDPLTEFLDSRSSTQTIHYGSSDVDRIRQLARFLSEQDQALGGDLGAQSAVTQLADIANWLVNTSAPEKLRHAMYSAVGDLADTVGGMCFDAGLYQKAMRCFRFSAGCAAEARDWSMRAKALSGLANLSVHQGVSDDALSFAEESLVRADRLSPMVQSVMYSRHARALAATGLTRSEDCFTAVRKAEEKFSLSSGDAPEWLVYYDGARFERDCGRALTTLALAGGPHEEAEQRLRRSLEQWPELHSRGRSLAVANLAALTLVHGDPQEAVTLGNGALAAYQVNRSDRVLEALRQLHDVAPPRPLDASVRELRHRVSLVIPQQRTRRS